MPKDRRTRSVSFERQSRSSPLACSSSTHHRHSSSPSSSQNPIEPSTTAEDIKEWEEARCPVCMEHPHNAVLLLCSCHEKGCRAYMCDTSYRHSNCLDQFRKASSGSTSLQDNLEQQTEPTKLTCPLCRGVVSRWTVVETARRHMDAKVRSCSMESCTYSGPYGELRKHARTEHPSVRPSEADPQRQRDWRRMERQRDIEDVLSSIRSALGGEDREFGFNEGFTFRLIFLVIDGPSVALTLPRVTPGVPSRVRTRSRRRRELALWGETYDSELGSTGRTSNVNNSFDLNESGWPTRSRRRREFAHLGETYGGELGSTGRTSNVNEGLDLLDESGWSDGVALTPSQHGQERRRRRMRTPDEDDM